MKNLGDISLVFSHIHKKYLKDCSLFWVKRGSSLGRGFWVMSLGIEEGSGAFVVCFRLMLLIFGRVHCKKDKKHNLIYIILSKNIYQTSKSNTTLVSKSYLHAILLFCNFCKVNLNHSWFLGEVSCTLGIKVNCIKVENMWTLIFTITLFNH